jgi:hypothetical protein
MAAAEFAARGPSRPGQTRRETGTQSQGSPGYPPSGDRPAAGADVATPFWRCAVNANLARFTRWALAGAVPFLSLTLSLTLQFGNDRGIRWLL